MFLRESVETKKENTQKRLF